MPPPTTASSFMIAVMADEHTCVHVRETKTKRNIVDTISWPLIAALCATLWSHCGHVTSFFQPSIVNCNNRSLVL